MAPKDTKSNKRKGATDLAPKPKKAKKSEDATAAKKPTKPAKALAAAVEPVDSIASTVKSKSTTKTPRKRAQDFFDDDVPTTAAEEPKAGAEVTGHKSKKSKKGEKKTKDAEAKTGAVAEAETNGVKEEKRQKSKGDKKKSGSNDAVVAEAQTNAANTKEPKQKRSKKSKAADAEVVAAEAEVDDIVEDDDEGEDDQTAALLAGFESSGDEEDAAEDADFEEQPKAAITQALRSELEKAAQKKDDEAGVVFVGRLPHGFFEPQMKAYFSQFGKIRRLRLSRNKATGASKHYAFVEFAHAEVAKIVAQTMNNYLMFGHILQCKVIPDEQVHPELFKGANTRFKAAPRNKQAGRALERGASRDAWAKRILEEKKRRNRKSQQLKDLMDYELPASALKSVDDVPKKALAVEDGAAKLLIEAAHEEGPGGAVDVLRTAEPKADGVTVTEKVTVKKTKKGSKGKTDDVSVADVAEEVAEAVLDKTPKREKSSRGKKAKKEETTEPAVSEPTATVSDSTPKKARATRGSKNKKEISEAADPVVEEITESKADDKKKGRKAKKAKA